MCLTPREPGFTEYRHALGQYEIHSVVGTRMDSVSERIKRAHGEGWSHRGFYLLSRHPPDFAGFHRGMRITASGPTPIHQGNYPLREIFVNTRETFDRDLKTGFLKHLAPHTVLKGLVQFEDATGRLPMTVIVASNNENPIVVIEDNPGDTHGVFRRACHNEPLKSNPMPRSDMAVCQVLD